MKNNQIINMKIIEHIRNYFRNRNIKKRVFKSPEELYSKLEGKSLAETVKILKGPKK